MKELEINITKTWRKSLSLRFDTKGVLQVRAPKFMLASQIQSFLKKHLDWIEKNHKKSQDKILPDNQIQELKKLARAHIPSRVAHFAEVYGFHYNMIRISSAQTRWGSCSSKKTLSFSYRLMQYPQECIDYVIVHELCHLRQMNHSAKFWQEVQTIMPDYRQQEKILKMGRDFA